MLSKIILIAAVATAVSAEGFTFPQHLAHKAQLEARAQLQARQADPTACLEALVSAFDSVPTPAPALLTYVVSHPITDACSYTVPASLSSALTNYESSVLSWWTGHSDDINAALSICPDAGVNTDDIAVCTKNTGSGSGAGAGGLTTTTRGAGLASKTSAAGVANPTDSGFAAGTDVGFASGTGAGFANPTDSGFAGSTGSGNFAAATTSSKNASPRETGLIGAVVAAAGFIGAVAVVL
ncbi:hypothetical protein B0H63DRAFT_107250 [Podospora didyma]|uniref:Infection structure specific protein n=1 Tax=Podospora didyma TaxID=330526 RepID=A0AAE0U4D8_9PEZI|nr:hypothetical protein B0H63DRAFT_107250 [Podospora didyma]